MMSVSSFFPGWSAWKSRARRFSTSGDISPLYELYRFFHVCDCKPFITHDAQDGHAFPFKKMVYTPVSHMLSILWPCCSSGSCSFQLKECGETLFVLSFRGFPSGRDRSVFVPMTTVLPFVMRLKKAMSPGRRNISQTGCEEAFGAGKGGCKSQQKREPRRQ